MGDKISQPVLIINQIKQTEALSRPQSKTSGQRPLRQSIYLDMIHNQQKSRKKNVTDFHQTWSISPFQLEKNRKVEIKIPEKLDVSLDDEVRLMEQNMAGFEEKDNRSSDRGSTKEPEPKILLTPTLQTN
jgi:hypothetical protein